MTRCSGTCHRHCKSITCADWSNNFPFSTIHYRYIKLYEPWTQMLLLLSKAYVLVNKHRDKHSTSAPPEMLINMSVRFLSSDHCLISLQCSFLFCLRLTENQALTVVSIFQTRGFKEHKRNKRQPLHHSWQHSLCHGAHTQLPCTSWLANIDVWPIGMELVCFHEYQLIIY